MDPLVNNYIDLTIVYRNFLEQAWETTTYDMLLCLNGGKLKDNFLKNEFKEIIACQPLLQDKTFASFLGNN